MNDFQFLELVLGCEGWAGGRACGAPHRSTNGLYGLQHVVFRGDAKRTLDGLNGNYKLAVCGFGYEDAFQALQASAPDSDSLPRFQERVQRATDSRVQKPLDGLDLRTRNCAQASPETDPAQHAGSLQDGVVNLWRRGCVDKCIAGEKSGIQNLSSVAPLAHLANRWYESGHSFARQLGCDFYFMFGARMDGEPLAYGFGREEASFQRVNWGAYQSVTFLGEVGLDAFNCLSRLASP